MEYDIIYQNRLLKFKNFETFVEFLRELKAQQGEKVKGVDKVAHKARQKRQTV